MAVVPEQPKQFAPMEREFYEDQAREKCDPLYGDFEALRMCLHLYPQAFFQVRDFVQALPYNDKNRKLDAFYAYGIAQVMDRGADRILEIGTKDKTDPHLHLQHVDLRAAKQMPDVDDHRVEESARNQSDTGQSSTARTDKDIADSAEGADDAAIRDSLGKV